MLVAQEIWAAGQPYLSYPFQTAVGVAAFLALVAVIIRIKKRRRHAVAKDKPPVA